MVFGKLDLITIKVLTLLQELEDKNLTQKIIKFLYENKEKTYTIKEIQELVPHQIEGYGRKGVKLDYNKVINSLKNDGFITTQKIGSDIVYYITDSGIKEYQKGLRPSELVKKEQFKKIEEYIYQKTRQYVNADDIVELIMKGFDLSQLKTMSKQELQALLSGEMDIHIALNNLFNTLYNHKFA